jgi:hypothetical protein
LFLAINTADQNQSGGHDRLGRAEPLLSKGKHDDFRTGLSQPRYFFLPKSAIASAMPGGVGANHTPSPCHDKKKTIPLENSEVRRLARHLQKTLILPKIVLWSEPGHFHFLTLQMAKSASSTLSVDPIRKRGQPIVWFILHTIRGPESAALGRSGWFPGRSPRRFAGSARACL